MTDRNITDLLMNLSALQDSVSVFVRSDRYDNRGVTVARAARDKVRDAILDEFAALRQQRDKLAETLKEIALTSSGSLCSRFDCSIDNPICGSMIARAALASIEKEGSDD